MLVKIDKAEYLKPTRLSKYCEFPLIQSVLQQKQEGCIYSDISGDGSQDFVVHKSGFAYYISSEDKDPVGFINFIETTHDLPQFFHLYSPPSSLLTALTKQNKYDYRTRDRIALQLPNTSILHEHNMNDMGYEVFEITEANYDIVNKDNFIGNKYWESKTNFLENGFGVCIFDNNKNPLAICYSACVVNNLAEVDIITIPEYRNKGLAKIVATEFVKLCRKKNIIPNWDCFEENIGSLKTAVGVGFIPAKEYIFLSLYKKK